MCRLLLKAKSICELGIRLLPTKFSISSVSNLSQPLNIVLSCGCPVNKFPKNGGKLKQDAHLWEPSSIQKKTYQQATMHGCILWYSWLSGFFLRKKQHSIEVLHNMQDVLASQLKFEFSSASHLKNFSLRLARFYDRRRLPAFAVSRAHARKTAYFTYALPLFRGLSALLPSQVRLDL